MKRDLLRLFDEQVLRQKAEKIEVIDESIIKLAQQMIETMVANNGIGLAGNQVGVLKQIIVVDLRPCGYKIEPFALINPEIVEAAGSDNDEEGCLSFPELFLQIARPEKIKVIAQNLKNEKVEVFADGLLTRILCHEIDHLNGVLFIDHANEEQQRIIKDFIDNFSEQNKYDSAEKIN